MPCRECPPIVIFTRCPLKSRAQKNRPSYDVFFVLLWDTWAVGMWRVISELRTRIMWVTVLAQANERVTSTTDNEYLCHFLI